MCWAEQYLPVFSHHKELTVGLTDKEGINTVSRLETVKLAAKRRHRVVAVTLNKNSYCTEGHKVFEVIKCITAMYFVE